MNTMTYAPGGLAAADKVRSLGRNEDTQLVHMTPGEVQALQAMAEKHGGSLTINPHTGLPEAGFLSGLLSVALPAAAMFVPGVGAAIGGIGAGITGGAASGALEMGLGMGLLTGGLTALGTGDLGKGLTSGLTSGLMTGAMTAFNPTAASKPGMATTTAATDVPALRAAEVARAEEALNTGVNTGLLQPGTSMMTNPAVANPYIQPAAVAAQAGAAAAPAAGGLSGWWGGLSPMQKVGVGGAGLLGLAALTEKQPGVNVPTDKGTIRPYEYKTAMAAPTAGRTQYVQPVYDAQGNPVLDTRERNYFNQSFSALPTYAAANGGLMALGSMDQNNMYPQSQQEHTNFATPTQMPTSAEVIDADYDPKTNAYTGQEMPRMADGGSTNEYTYDPQNQKYAVVTPPVAEPDYSNVMFMGQPGIFGNLVNQLNAQEAGAGNQWAKSVMGFMPGFGLGAASQQNSGFGNPFGWFMRDLTQQAQNAQPNLQNYAYNPQTQQYVKMADGGDITAGYQGYGQDNQGGRNPLDLLRLLKDNQQQPQQQTTVIRQASGGLSDLGSYSDGGRLLKGPGTGISDDIPAMIGKHQPARLADGEFVIPARIVSELGQGSTDAGARRLYQWMDDMQELRKKTVGKGKVAVNTKAEKHLPT